MIITDGSRSFDLATTQYIDCENVVKLYDVYKLLICFGCACVLLSTVQYFDLNERLRAMKGTLSRSGAELFPFMAVLSLFFLTYTLIGMYLFGRHARAVHAHGASQIPARSCARCPTH